MDETLIQFKPSNVDVAMAEQQPPATRCPICDQHFSSDARFCPFDGEALQPAPDWDPHADPLIGQTVDGRYEVLGVLGEGGMGTVYEVRHVSLGRHFALKALRHDLAQDGELSARFIREARAAAAVSHPNVVQITDFGQLPSEQPYFVMELLGGLSLRTLIRNGGSIPAARAVRILRQIAEAIGAAHEAGIIHRDLKPDNVHVGGAVGDHDVVKVLDFGLAKVVGTSRLTRQGIVFGTPHYMSPEQAAGDEIDHRSDIYALGVVMYEMFTGQVPFEADTYMGVLTKHMYMKPVPPSKLLGGTKHLGALEDITLRCLEKRPSLRFANLGDLVKELDQIVHFTQTGSLDIVPSSSRPHQVDNVLADALEAPSTEELHIALRRAGIPQQTRTPGLLIALSAIALGLLIGWALLDDEPVAVAPPAPPMPVPSAVVEAAPEIDPLPEVIVVPSPKPEEAPPPPSAYTAPKPPRRASNRQPKSAPVTRAPAPRQKRSTSAGEIVDPWAE